MKEDIMVYISTQRKPPPKFTVKYNADTSWKNDHAIINFTISDHTS